MRLRRAERRLSMTALERLAGLGHTTVSRALNGPTVPSEATVLVLASCLRLEPGPLLELRQRALPRREPGSGVAPAGRDEVEFEKRYLRYVDHRHGQLSVVGLDLSRPERACWPLDAAYLSLEFAIGVERRPALGAADLQGASGPAGQQVRIERAEQALAGLRRVLVRGLAGSGKTTLLQWLAVAASRGELPFQLESLADCVPFVLPLRTLVRRGGLPSPREFLAAVGCPLDSAQPSGWADRVLAAGRGILLVDGLDEVPQAQRAHTKTWLLELLAAYPQVSVVVTGRPSAVPDGWLAGCGFTELTVRAMSPADVMVFATRWHAAAASGAAGSDEQDHLAGLEAALKEAVRSQRDLARLATTPLLCALMCALHRDRRGHLPQRRMELYEAALSMLLVRRDRERDIAAPEGLVLTEHQSVQLLQRLAYWLVRNGQTEMDRDTAQHIIGEALPAMPQVEAQGCAQEVFEHLLARSGLLRAPAADTVDFIHRTFQDYLGAKAAVEARDLPLLVRHAHDDQWEDVVRLAVGHARPHERASLLRRLIARGDRTPRHRARLYLLATACLETATELDPVVRQQIEERTATLLPPRSPQEAVELAAVGPVVLDLLAGPEGLEEDEAEAVVRTAALIGGDAGMHVIRRFRDCTHPAVTWQLQNAWGRFDTQDYAREILSEMPGRQFLHVTTPEQLAVLRTFAPPAGATVTGNLPVGLLIDSAGPTLEYLQIEDNPSLRDLGFLRSCPNLDHLGLYECPGLVDIADVNDHGVRSFSLFGCDLVSPGALRNLAGLRRLGLDMPLPRRRLDALPGDADLAYLFLGRASCEGLTLKGISRWQNMDSLSLCGPAAGMAELNALPRLKLLSLQGGAERRLLQDTSVVLPQVEEVFLGNWTEEKDEPALRALTRVFPELRRLTISQHHEVHRIDLSPLRDVPNLVIRLNGPGGFTGTEHFPPGAITQNPRPRT
ncbi:NACHT domain-containing protein [Kitasatospora sp. NPDC051853]|uniref:NACHT domain-containing protein n=1 Tax=Kitasatospora sp. NPDC051853 TaxID=3364058 RepID=UPI0037B93469